MADKIKPYEIVDGSSIRLISGTIQIQDISRITSQKCLPEIPALPVFIFFAVFMLIPVPFMITGPLRSLLFFLFLSLDGIIGIYIIFFKMHVKEEYSMISIVLKNGQPYIVGKFPESECKQIKDELEALLDN
jgi:carbon starvation protein CstA